MNRSRTTRDRNTSNPNANSPHMHPSSARSNFPSGGSRSNMGGSGMQGGLDSPDSSGPQEKPMDSWRLALLGDGGVGKTALAVQTYDPTIEDAYRKSTKPGDQKCFIEIIDTAGQEEYATIRDQWVWESAGFVLVFSLGSMKSLDRVRLFYTTVIRVQRADPILILVGNKLDQKRVVRQEDAIDFAREIGATYIETSAKTAHNVSAVFVEPIQRLRNKHAHVADSYDLKGRLPLPPNPQSVEAPPGAIAAVAAQEAARAMTKSPASANSSMSPSSARGSIDRMENLGPLGPLWTAPLPLNRLLLGEYPEGPTENPLYYAPGGQTGPCIFEHQLPPGVRYAGRLDNPLPGVPSTYMVGTSRTRSSTNTSLPGNAGGYSPYGSSPSSSFGGGGTIAGSRTNFGRKMSDPQFAQYGGVSRMPTNASNMGMTTSGTHGMSPGMDKGPVKKKSGALGSMFGKKGAGREGGRKEKKDDGCVVQ